MTITVVHCMKQAYDVYIGRTSGGIRRGTIGADGFWGNPFEVENKDGEEIPGSSEQVVRQYMEWLCSPEEIWYDRPQRSNKQVMGRLMSAELKDKVLGCWCRPKLCHGDVLVMLTELGEKWNDIPLPSLIEKANELADGTKA